MESILAAVKSVKDLNSGNGVAKSQRHFPPVLHIGFGLCTSTGIRYGYLLISCTYLQFNNFTRKNLKRFLKDSSDFPKMTSFRLVKPIIRCNEKIIILL